MEPRGCKGQWTEPVEGSGSQAVAPPLPPPDVGSPSASRAHSRGHFQAQPESNVRSPLTGAAGARRGLRLNRVSPGSGCGEPLGRWARDPVSSSADSTCCRRWGLSAGLLALQGVEASFGFPPGGKAAIGYQLGDQRNGSWESGTCQGFPDWPWASDGEKGSVC